MRRILRTRKRACGICEALVEWTGTDPETGQPWEPSWEPETYVTDDALAEHEVKHTAARKTLVDGINMGPLLDAARASIARSVTIAKTKNRPHTHKIDLPQFMAAPLALAFIELMRRPAVFATDVSRQQKTLPVGKVKGDGCEVYQVVYKAMNDIADFASLAFFLDPNRATGCMLARIGRASNKDIMTMVRPAVTLPPGPPSRPPPHLAAQIPGRESAVEAQPHPPRRQAPPMLVTATIKGETATCTIEFNTAGINGYDGSLRMPAATPGSYIKKEKVRQRIVKYVRENLPPRHGLRAKKWHLLPDNQYQIQED